MNYRVIVLLFVLVIVPTFTVFAFPGTGKKYTPGSCGSGATTTLFLISGATWTVPADWCSASNTIEVIGGGGGGGVGGISKGAGGGGGGAYSKISNLTLTQSSVINIQVGAGGAAAGTGGDTWLQNAATVMAKGGVGGTTGNFGAPGPGGLAASGVGTVKFSGGSGGGPNGGFGTGGGGAAGPSGVGADGLATGDGGAGDAGFGGAAGVSANPGNAGGNGTEWDASHGSGGGGGAGSTGGGGGNGGNFGAGGGAGAKGSPPGGLGGPGLIVVKYRP